MQGSNAHERQVQANGTTSPDKGSRSLNQRGIRYLVWDVVDYLMPISTLEMQKILRDGLRAIDPPMTIKEAQTYIFIRQGYDQYFKKKYKSDKTPKVNYATI